MIFVARVDAQIIQITRADFFANLNAKLFAVGDTYICGKVRC